MLRWRAEKGFPRSTTCNSAEVNGRALWWESRGPGPAPDMVITSGTLQGLILLIEKNLDARSLFFKYHFCLENV